MHINSLPTELLGEIFEVGAKMAVDMFAAQIEARWLEDMLQPGSSLFSQRQSFHRRLRFAGLVSLVCKLWRSLALFTPTLWSYIHITADPDSVTFTRDLFRRSGSCALDIVVAPSRVSTLAVYEDLLAPNLTRCRSFHLVDAHYKNRAVAARVLQTCTSAPLLEHLEIDRISSQIIFFAGNSLPRLKYFRGDSFRLLDSSMSTLRSLEIQGLLPARIYTESRIFLPHMTVLRLVVHAHELQSIFRVLDMPKLVALTLLDDEGFGPAIETVLSESSSRERRVFSRITHLIVEVPGDPTCSGQTLRMLYGVCANLRYLQLHVALPGPFLSRLAGVDFALEDAAPVQVTDIPCPHLETLAIFHQDGTARNLLRAVLDRREQGSLRLKKLILPEFGGIDEDGEWLRDHTSKVHFVPSERWGEYYAE